MARSISRIIAAGLLPLVVSLIFCLTLPNTTFAQQPEPAAEEAPEEEEEAAAEEEEEAAAEEETAPAPEDVEEIVVTGTRREGLSPTETLSPIDSFGAVNFEHQASFDLTDQLSNIAPSFNTQRFPIADNTAFIRPANLRNLPPDETLVLVNGHRRHRSALINLQVEPFGTVNQGSQAVDFGLIPSGAIERIEILRDGSSAQYGSDAIAGVINVILKDHTDGLTVTQQVSGTYEDDGDEFITSANLGLPFGEDGFFNATVEYINSDPTSRGSARPDAVAVREAVGFAPFNGLGQRWGDPDVEGTRMFFNMETDASENIRAYGHGSYADQEFDSSFFFRAPVGVPGVTPRATLFVDNNGDGQPDPVPQQIVDDLLQQGLDPNEFITADPSSPSGFVALNPVAELLPAGYTPTLAADIEDFEGVLGLRGETFFGLSWDVSGRFGANKVQNILRDSINPALGINTPRDFRPGKLEQREKGINLDLVYPLDLGVLASPINIAFGAEWRREEYQIGVGDAASIATSPTGVLFGIGSDGFQGDTPEAAGTFDRDSWAGYLDIEADIFDWWTLGFANRVEASEDFETSYDWKVSSRFQVHPRVAVRGTANTGFRAATPGQINTLDVTTSLDAQGNLVPLGTFPVNSQAAIALGAKPLENEDSFGFTGGIVFTPFDNVSLTVDYYNIDVDDRIALASFAIAPGSPEQQALIDAGVEGANLLSLVSFFTNGFDSTVEGVEGVLTADVDLGRFGYAIFDLRHSWNDQDVNRVEPGTISQERVFDLENQLPSNRTVFSVDYRAPFNFDIFARLNRFSGWKDSSVNSLGGGIATFGDEYLVDVILTYHFLDRFHFSAGAENIGDNLPDPEQDPVLRFIGATRPVSSPFGFNGGRWFVRLAIDVF